MNPNEKSKMARRLSKRAVTLALAAALLLALGVTGYAAGLFRMHVGSATEADLAHFGYYEIDAAGNYLNPEEQFPEDGLVFTFDAAAEIHEIEFQPNWLPGTPTLAEGYRFSSWEEDGWYYLVTQDAYSDGRSREGDLGIRYQIYCRYASSAGRMILPGEYQLVKTETWGEYAVMEVTVRPPRGDYGTQNFVLLFSEGKGHLIVIGGSDDLETLEHIARELEIRETGKVRSPSETGYSMISVGRG